MLILDLLNVLNHELVSNPIRNLPCQAFSFVPNVIVSLLDPYSVGRVFASIVGVGVVDGIVVFEVDVF